MFNLSIIIVSYNTKELTVACVETILEESLKLNCEIIIVDNNSKDGSVEGLRKLWRGNSNIKLFENKTNVGFAKAVNIGIENSKGVHILLLNSDTIVKKGALKKLIKFADNTPDAGVLGARLLNEDGSVQGSCYNFPTIANAIKEFWLGIKGAYEKFAPKGKGTFEVEVVVGAVFLITQKALEVVGKLDEKYFMYIEDIDYCLRVSKAGLKTYYLSDVHVTHYHGESGKGSSKKQMQRLISSSKLYHGPLKHFLINAIIWSGQKWQKLIKNQN